VQDAAVSSVLQPAKSGRVPEPCLLQSAAPVPHGEGSLSRGSDPVPCTSHHPASHPAVPKHSSFIQSRLSVWPTNFLCDNMCARLCTGDRTHHGSTSRVGAVRGCGEQDQLQQHHDVPAQHHRPVPAAAGQGGAAADQRRADQLADQSAAEPAGAGQAPAGADQKPITDGETPTSSSYPVSNILSLNIYFLLSLLPTYTRNTSSS